MEAWSQVSRLACSIVGRQKGKQIGKKQLLTFKFLLGRTEEIPVLKVLETVLPLAVVCLVGPMSDLCGRKWFLLANLTGQTLLPLGYLLLYLLPSGHLPVWALVLPSIPAALVGLDTIFSHCVFSYAGDVSHGKSARSTSIRFIIIDTLNNLFIPVGLYGGNFILQRGGFEWLFGFIAGVLGLCIVYVLVAITNVIPHAKENEPKEEVEGKESKPTCSRRLVQLFRSLATSVIRKREGYGRLIIILLLIILGTHAISYTADSNICYIFLQTKFGFNQNDFSNLQSIHFALTGAGALFMIGVLQLTNINVLVMGLVSALSKLGYYLECVSVTIPFLTFPPGTPWLKTPLPWASATPWGRWAGLCPLCARS
jgi:hypothetical protein